MADALAASPLLLLLTGVMLPSRGFVVELAAGLGYLVLARCAISAIGGSCCSCTAAPRLPSASV